MSTYNYENQPKIVDDDRRPKEEVLKDYEQRGWELVKMTFESDGNIKYIFKKNPNIKS